MTDITELAQREKFEAWVMTKICISKSTLEGLRTSDGYRNSTLSGRDYNLMWNLWKAAGAELVEALEKAKGMETYWKTQCRGITDHCEELQARIAELESRTVTPVTYSENADADYCRKWAWQQVKGEVSTEGWTSGDNANYFGFFCWGWDMRRQYNEQRPVTVKLPQRLQPDADGWDDWYVHSDDEGEYLKFDDVLAMLTVAGIKVEAQ